MDKKRLLTLFLAGAVCVTSGIVSAGPLVGYWPFDGSLKDLAGTADGTFVGGTAAYQAGKIVQAISFDGVNDYVDIPSPTNPALYTISVWVKPARTSAAGVITRTDASGPTTSWSHQLRIESGTFHHYLWVGAERHVPGTTTIVPDTWYHVAITAQNSGPMRLYVNGKEDGVSIDTAGTLWATGTRIFVGSNSGHGMGWFQGQVDDLRIYNRELSAAQIKDTFNGTPPAFTKAEAPVPADGAVGVNMPLLQWTKGETALFHNVYVGTTPQLTEANLVAARQPFAMVYLVQGLQPGVTYYWRVDEIDAAGVVTAGDAWSFTSEPLTAYRPEPADGATNLFPSQTLNWLPGKAAVKHQVYFSSILSDVEGGTAAADKGKVTDTKLSPGLLRSSTTYYWRVDEILADGTSNKGPAWSFTTADGVSKKVVRQWWSNTSGTAVSALTGSPNYPNRPTGTELLDAFGGPVNWADNYGTRMYGWLTPPQSGDYTFWIASDDLSELWLSTDADPAHAVAIARVATYTNSQEWTKEAGQKSATIKLQAGNKYFIQALHKEGTGGDNLAVSWQGPGIATQQVIKADYVDTFALPPLQAYSPSPANGAVDAPQSGALSWGAGEKAQKHDLYFGTDKAAIAAADTKSPLYQGQQSGTSFEAGALEWGKIFYWRVDEINAGEAGSPWKGTVWSFITANFIPIDNMESYTDEEGSRIFDAWIDGWTNSTGSTVGNVTAPFAERTIVHGGKQAMPLDYNNLRAPFYSEAEYAFAPLQNWTGNGVTDLSLWVRGNPVSFQDKGNNAFTISAGGNDIWNNADAFRFAYKKLSGNGSLTARVESIGNTDVWAKAGVMIRETLDAGSKHAMIAVTPGNSCAFQWRPAPDGASSSSNWTGVAVRAPYWIRITRTGNAFKGETSPDGKTWTQLGTDTTVTIGTSVYIGLAVTAHNAAAVTTAEFSNVATSGSVTGVWQVAAIGSDPQPGNSPDKLYVAVEDSAGKVAVATNADPAAVLAAAWTEWKVPLSSLTGVNLAKVKKLYLGVGDRKSPVADGTGRIYIDDIRVTRP